MKKLIYILTALASVFAVTSCNDTLSMAELTEKMNETVENAALDTDDKDRPVLELVEAAKSETAVKNKSGLYENMKASQLENILGTESGKKYHTKSIWIHAKGNDASTGIKYLKVHEKLLKKTDGTDVSSQNITADSKAGTDKMGKSNFAEGWFEYKFVLGYDGIVELTFTAVDFGGNESLETASFVVLKDTTLLLEDFMCFNKTAAYSFENMVQWFKPSAVKGTYEFSDGYNNNTKLLDIGNGWSENYTSYGYRNNPQNHNEEYLNNFNGSELERLARTVYLNFNDDEWFPNCTTSITDMITIDYGYDSLCREGSLPVSKHRDTVYYHGRHYLATGASSRTEYSIPDYADCVYFELPESYNGERNLYFNIRIKDEAGNEINVLRVIPKTPVIYATTDIWGETLAVVKDVRAPSEVDVSLRMCKYSLFDNYMDLFYFAPDVPNIFLNGMSENQYVQTKYTFYTVAQGATEPKLQSNNFEYLSLYSLPSTYSIKNTGDVKAPVIKNVKAEADPEPNSGVHNLTLELDITGCSEDEDVTYTVFTGVYWWGDYTRSYVFDIDHLNEELTVTVPTLNFALYENEYSVEVIANKDGYSVSSNKVYLEEVSSIEEGHDNIPPVYTDDSSESWSPVYTVDPVHSEICVNPAKWGENEPENYYFYLIPYTDDMGENLDYFSTEEDLKSYIPKKYKESSIPFSDLVEHNKYYIVEKRYDLSGNYGFKGIMFFDKSIFQLNSKIPYSIIRETGKYDFGLDLAGYNFDSKMEFYALFSSFDGEAWSTIDSSGYDVSLKENTLYESDFGFTNRNYGLFRKVNITGSTKNSFWYNQLITSRPLYFYNPLLKCDLKNLVEGNTIMTVLCDQPALIQLVTSTRNYGANASDWVTYCGGGGILNEEVVKTTTNYRVDDSAVPSGNYYVVIVHFADGTTAISKVHQKK